jgi:hypothetical protein
VRVVFDGEVPDAARAELAPFFPLMDSLAPQWCSRLRVRWKAACAEDDCLACTVTLYEYRYGTITFHGGWLDGPPDWRRETVVHEVLHLYVQPLSGYTRHLIGQLVEGDALTAVTKEQCREYQESVVQDLTLLVARLL